MESRGFTLIELLIVISIIALLLAMVLPAFSSVRSQARATLCQTHLRNLLLEFEQYAQSENGAFPFGSIKGVEYAPSDGWAGYGTIDMMRWWWFDFIETVNHSDLRDSETLECPSKRFEDHARQASVLWGNYGVNEALCVPTQLIHPEKPVVRRARFRHEFRRLASTILIADSGHARISWTQATSDPPDYIPYAEPGTPYIPGMEINKQRTLDDEVVEDAISGRHPGKTINIGFADGHLERKPADFLLVEKREENTYTNIKPLWEP